MSNKPTITVITPTTGTKALSKAVASVANQTIKVRHVIVADGKQYMDDVLREVMNGWDGKFPAPDVCCIPDNTGKDAWNGHKIYAHYSQLIDTDYLCFLDEDNTFDPNHCESLLERAKQYGFAWSYRNIYLEGEYIGKDIKESVGTPHYVGYSLVDTSCWMFSRDNIKLLNAILTQWSGDRDLTKRFLHEYEGTFYSACTGQHTMNYNAPQSKQHFYRSICEN